MNYSDVTQSVSYKLPIKLKDTSYQNKTQYEPIKQVKYFKLGVNLGPTRPFIPIDKFVREKVI